MLFPARDFDNRTSAAFALAQVSPADGLLLTHYGPNPAYDGKTIAQIAQLRHEDDTTTLDGAHPRRRGRAREGRRAPAR